MRHSSPFSDLFEGRCLSHAHKRYNYQADRDKESDRAKNMNEEDKGIPHRTFPFMRPVPHAWTFVAGMFQDVRIRSIIFRDPSAGSLHLRSTRHVAHRAIPWPR